MNAFVLPKSNRVMDLPKSIADQIYETLRNGIIKGEIEPGHRLFEVEVAKMFDASRTPVREAFRRLEQDALAERLAQGGIRVPQLDEQTIHDLFALRALLETHAIELACERITPEEIAILKQCRVQAYELLKFSEVNRDFTLNMILELNSSFHDVIYKSARSKFLIKVLVNIRAVVLSLRTISLRLDSLREIWDEHSEMIDHLENRDKEGAVRLLNQHISKTASQILSYIRSQGPCEDDRSAPDSTRRAAGRQKRKSGASSKST